MCVSRGRHVTEDGSHRTVLHLRRLQLFSRKRKCKTYLESSSLLNDSSCRWKRTSLLLLPKKVCETSSLSFDVDTRGEEDEQEEKMREEKKTATSNINNRNKKKSARLKSPVTASNKFLLSSTSSSHSYINIRNKQISTVDVIKEDKKVVKKFLMLLSLVLMLFVPNEHLIPLPSQVYCSRHT